MQSLRKAKSGLQKRRKYASLSVSPVVSNVITPVKRNKIHRGHRYLDLTIREVSEKSYITAKRRSIDVAEIENNNIKVTNNKLLTIM